MDNFFVLNKDYSRLFSSSPSETELADDSFHQNTNNPPIIAPNPATCNKTKTGCVFPSIKYQTQVAPNCAKERTKIRTATIIALTK